MKKSKNELLEESNKTVTLRKKIHSVQTSILNIGKKVSEMAKELEDVKNNNTQLENKLENKLEDLNVKLEGTKNVRDVLGQDIEKAKKRHRELLEAITTKEREIIEKAVVEVHKELDNPRKELFKVNSENIKLERYLNNLGKEKKNHNPNRILVSDKEEVIIDIMVKRMKDKRAVR